MKALILNAGMGTRMGMTSGIHPKCMTEIAGKDTILSRQLRMLEAVGIHDAVIVTGAFSAELENYCRELGLDIGITYVHNARYAETNYITSLDCARAETEHEDILLLHGDMVFDRTVLEELLACNGSAMTVSSACEPCEKDFQVVIRDGRIRHVQTGSRANEWPAWPMYHLTNRDWTLWLDMIRSYCLSGKTGVYAEDALNEVLELCDLTPLDIAAKLCREIDTPEDLTAVRLSMGIPQPKTVYMCFSTDMLHSAHMAIISKAAKLGRLTVGVLSDEAVASYKHYPLMPFNDRKALFENIADVHHVIEQKTLSYRDNLLMLHPDYVAHGDDWREGTQKPIRDETELILGSYGGTLVEFPYTRNSQYSELEEHIQTRLSIPDIRRGRLRKLLALKPCLCILEAHNGITGLIAEKTSVHQEGAVYQFDGMWVSSLCDSTAKGKPDIELVDISSRLRTVDEIMEVTTKPIILDGDTGGLTEHFIYTVKTLERMGVSAIIIEDKTGLKKNSLFGIDTPQTQDSIESFSAKISAGKRAQKTKEFMIIARIESLILERGMDDALERAYAFTRAGADGIMIHSRQKEPDEIFAFIRAFRTADTVTPLVVVPTTFNTVTEKEFAQRGVNIVIYANQLIRSGFPAMQKTASLILEHHRAKEADDLCMPIKDILTLIPEE
jgi:phosphoenolpyruvate phosphomutase